MTIPLHGAFDQSSASVLSRPPDHEFYQKWTEFAPNPTPQIRVFHDEEEIRPVADDFHCQLVKFPFHRDSILAVVLYSTSFQVTNLNRFPTTLMNSHKTLNATITF